MKRKITKEKPYCDNWGFTVTNVQLLSRARELNLNKNTVSNNESSPQIVSSSEEQTPGTEEIRVPRVPVPVPDPVMGAMTAKKGTADHVHNNDKDGHGLPDMFQVAVHSHALSTAT